LAFWPAGFRHPERRTVAVRDVIFVLLTLAVFAVLGLVVRAVEKL
jgi:small neutral amino acid transporter SnatA (MarC family)